MTRAEYAKWVKEFNAKWAKGPEDDVYTREERRDGEAERRSDERDGR